MATVMIGPVEPMGYPFEKMNHDAVRQLEIGEHLVYAFGRPYLYSDYEIIPAEPLDAVIAWDPGWYQTSAVEGSRNELARIKNTALHHKVPLVGMYCDWFSAWHGGTAFFGVPPSLPYCDAVVTDPVGAAAMRTIGVMQQKRGHLQWRPIETLDNYLTYGRLPHLGGDTYAVSAVPNDYPQSARAIDVSFIGSAHPGAVVHRSYYLEALIEACKKRHWRYEVRRGVLPDEMEQVLLDSKVCFNTSVGSSLNMRVFEAAAAGCVLLTDAHNTMNEYIKDFSFFYSKAEQVERLLEAALVMDRQPLSQRAVEFALENQPMTVWNRVITEATSFYLDDAWHRRPHEAEIPVLTKKQARALKPEVKLI